MADDQLDPPVTLIVCEQRGDARRDATIGPIPEPQGRALAGLLLNRTDDPPGAGPWRCAIAGGTRTVTIHR